MRAAEADVLNKSLPPAVDAFAYMEKALDGQLDVTMIFATEQDARDFAGDYFEHAIVRVRVTPLRIEHVPGHPRETYDDENSEETP